MDYVIVILGALVSIIAVFISYLEKSDENKAEIKNNRKNGHSFIVVVLGSLISLIGGVRSVNQQQDAEYNARKSQEQTDSLNRAIVKLEQSQIDTLRNVLATSLATNKLQQQVINAQNDLVVANNKNAALSEEIRKSVVGADSKPVVVFTVLPDYYNSRDSLVFQFRVINRGEYPIRNLNIIITDPNNHWQAIAHGDRYSQVPIDSVRSRYHIETLSPDRDYITFYSARLAYDYIKFNYFFEFHWLKGSFHYEIDGTIDQKSREIKIVSITGLPSSINPLEYVLISPKHVGDSLLKFKNPYRFD